MAVAARYFRFRSRLGEALEEVRRVAEASGAGERDLLAAEAHGAALYAPFEVAVTGLPGGGKSALVDALAGTPLVPGPGSPGHVPVRFDYGDEPQDEADVGGLSRFRRPVPFLWDFALTEVPLVAGDDGGMRPARADLVAGADAVVFVLGVREPWDAAAWSVLEGFGPAVVEKTVLVVQQADARGTATVDAVVKHAQRTVRARLGADVPVCAVSAERALIAKGAAAGPADEAALDEAGLEEGGFARFERMLGSVLVAGADSRRAEVGRAFARARAVLDKAAEGLADAEGDGFDGGAADDGAAAEEPGSMGEGAAGGEGGGMEAPDAGLAEMVEHCADDVRRRLRKPAALWTLLRRPGSIAGAVEERLRAGIAHRTGLPGGGEEVLVEGFCAAFQERLRVWRDRLVGGLVLAVIGAGLVGASALSGGELPVAVGATVAATGILVVLFAAVVDPRRSAGVVERELGVLRAGLGRRPRADLVLPGASGAGSGPGSRAADIEGDDAVDTGVGGLDELIVDARAALDRTAREARVLAVGRASDFAP